MATKTRNQTIEPQRKISPAKQSQASSPSKTASTNGSSPSSQDTLRHLYASLLRCRLAQEQARRSGGGYDLTVGHEAVIVGPTAELSGEDTIAATARNLAALVARGVPLGILLTDPKSADKPLLPPSVPHDPFNLATGIALAHKLEKQQHVVVAFCPQESPALETWHEALKFAGVHKLPVIFVIKNGVADQQTSSDHAPPSRGVQFYGSRLRLSRDHRRRSRRSGCLAGST